MFTGGNQILESIDSKYSAHIIFEPLFYSKFIKHSFEYYIENKSSLAKMTAPRYVVCVFSSREMLL